MLRGSTHAWKVNFCKFTNETRLAMEDASEHSGLKFLAALNGICAGGGYELALACDEIVLVDDGELRGQPAGNAAAWRAARHRRPDARRRQAQGAPRPRGRLRHGRRRREGQARGRVAARRRGLPDQPVQGARRQAGAGAGGEVGSAGRGAGHHAESAQSDGVSDDSVRYSSVTLEHRSRQARRHADRQGARRRQPSTPEAILAAGRSVLAAARVPRAGRRAAAAAHQRAGDRHGRPQDERRLPTRCWPSDGCCSRTRITGSCAR